MFPLLFGLAGYIFGQGLKDAIDYSQKRGRYQLQPPERNPIESLHFDQRNSLDDEDLEWDAIEHSISRRQPIGSYHATRKSSYENGGNSHEGY